MHGRAFPNTRPPNDTNSAFLLLRKATVRKHPSKTRRSELNRRSRNNGGGGRTQDASFRISIRFCLNLYSRCKQSLKTGYGKSREKPKKAGTEVIFGGIRWEMVKSDGKARNDLSGGKWSGQNRTPTNPAVQRVILTGTVRGLA